MKKILIIGLVIVVIGMLASIVYMLLSSKNTTPTETSPNTVFPIGNTVNNATDTTITIGASTGSVTVDNFLVKDDVVESTVNPGFYSLGFSFPENGSTPTKLPPYVIQYDASVQYFNISLLALPLELSRRDAEVYLQAQLGITEAEMCTLNYTVATPGFVSEEYSGQDFRFSFCPNAIPLQ